MDAHDGKVVQHTPGGLYYWYGMEYGKSEHNNTYKNNKNIF